MQQDTSVTGNAARQPAMATAAGRERLLIGRVALITGGGRGLGEALCQTLAADGATVIAGDIHGDLAKRVAARAARASGDAMALPFDVSDEHQAGEAIQHILERYGRLDILVNNAGVDVTAPIEQLSIADWDHVLGINLRGPFVLSKLALPIMKQQRQGHIINIASTAAKRTWANATAYHASKWGLLGLSHALHVEARPFGVKVTAVVCGGMRTPFILERFPETDPGLLQDPANVAEMIRFLLALPPETVIPEVMVLPLRETSWP